MARKKKQNSVKPIKALIVAPEQPSNEIVFERERLDDLLAKLGRSIQEARVSKGQLPEKIWFKQQFAVGVNEVTRVLERMVQSNAGGGSAGAPVEGMARRAPLVRLQVAEQDRVIRDAQKFSFSEAVIVASDVNPRWLTKHVPRLASSQQVPVICVKDNKGSSLRLGEVMKLKTAMAIGVKVKDSIINRTIDEVLHENSVVADTS